MIDSGVVPGIALRGRRSGRRYVVEARLGGHGDIVRARDERGQVVAIRFASARRNLHREAAWAVFAPAWFPQLRELDEAFVRAAGPVGLLVQEFISGYTLEDLAREGRMLEPPALARLRRSVQAALEDLYPWTRGQVRLGPSGVIFDTLAQRWRILSLDGADCAPRERRADTESVGHLLWAAGGGECGGGIWGGGRRAALIVAPRAAEPRLGEERLPRGSGLPVWMRYTVVTLIVLAGTGLLVHFA